MAKDDIDFLMFLANCIVPKSCRLELTFNHICHLYQFLSEITTLETEAWITVKTTISSKHEEEWTQVLNNRERF